MTTVDQILREQQDHLNRLVDADSYLSSGPTLQNFDWSAGPLSQAKQAKTERGVSCLDAVLQYLAEARLKMPFPVFHLWGPAGTGKSHILLGMARFLALNKQNFYPVTSVFWPEFARATLDGEEAGTNWTAPLLIIENLDDRPPITADGSTWALDLFLTRVHRRLTIDRKPTLISTRRTGDKLVQLLASSNKNGVVEHAITPAAEIASLISGTALVTGRTYGRNLKELAGRKPRLIQNMWAKAVEQDLASLGFITTSKTIIPIYF